MRFQGNNGQSITDLEILNTPTNKSLIRGFYFLISKEHNKIKHTSCYGSRYWKSNNPSECYVFDHSFFYIVLFLSINSFHNLSGDSYSEDSTNGNMSRTYRKSELARNYNRYSGSKGNSKSSRLIEFCDFVSDCFNEPSSKNHKSNRKSESPEEHDPKWNSYFSCNTSRSL